MIAYDASDWNALNHLAQQTTELKTVYAPLMNLLAYYYESKGNNLGEAQRLIDIALKADANNAHYLDTQAQIFYKQKEYAKAEAILSCTA